MLFVVATLFSNHALCATSQPSPPPNGGERQIEPSVYVHGGVRHPGRYDFSEGMTLLEAISAAGGFTDSAGWRVSIVHANGASASYTRGGTYAPPILRAGDRISVPKSMPKRLF